VSGGGFGGVGNLGWAGLWVELWDVWGGGSRGGGGGGVWVGKRNHTKCFSRGKSVFCGQGRSERDGNWEGKE